MKKILILLTLSIVYSCGSTKKISNFKNELEKLQITILSKVVKKERLHINFKIKNVSNEEYGGINRSMNIHFRYKIILENGESTMVSGSEVKKTGNKLNLLPGKITLEEVSINNPNITTDKNLNPKKVEIFLYGQIRHETPEFYRVGEVNWYN